MVLIGCTVQYYKLKLNCSGSPNHCNNKTYPNFYILKSVKSKLLCLTSLQFLAIVKQYLRTTFYIQGVFQ